MRARLPFLRSVVGLGAALALTAALVLALVRIDRVVVARGALAGGSIPLRAPLSGILREVHVHPGQDVAAGAVLFVVDDAALRAELAALEAELAAAEAQRAAAAERLRAGREERVPAERARAELELRRAEVQMVAARRRAEALDGLRGEGLVAELAYQDALDERRSAELALEQRRLGEASAAEALASELRALEDELRGLDDGLAGLRAGRDESARRLASARLTAELPGRWIGPAPEDLFGRRVDEGDELGRLAHGRPDRFRGHVDDLGRANVAGPLPVRVRVDGYPWLLHGSVSGRLARVDDVAATTNGFEVEVALEPHEPGLVHGDAPELFEGMRAEARILVEERVSLARLLFERFLGSEAP